MGAYPNANLVAQDMAIVSARILDQILLVIIFAGIKLRSGRNLSGDRTFNFSRLLDTFLYRFSHAPLFLAVIKNRRPILRADVIVLPVQRRWIMHAKKISEHF